MTTTKKTDALKLGTTSVFALLSSVAALARPRADREVKDNARIHLSAHLEDLRKATPRSYVELASGSAPTNKIPRRDKVDELLDALSVLGRDDAAPDARSAAMDRLVTYFEGLIGEGPAKFEAASIAALKAKVSTLTTRVGRAEAASSLQPAKARAARPVVAPAELAALGAIGRAAQNTMFGMKKEKR